MLRNCCNNDLLMWGGFGRLVFIGSGLVWSCCWTSEVVEERGVDDVLHLVSALSCHMFLLSFEYIRYPPPLQPTSTPTRSWAGERKPLRSAPWKRDTSMEFSCTSEHSDWSSFRRETIKYVTPMMQLAHAWTCYYFYSLVKLQLTIFKYETLKLCESLHGSMTRHTRFV